MCLIAELNVGGIVAAVLVTLILLGVLVLGIWFAYRRGYFDSEYLPSKALLFIVLLSGHGSWVPSEYWPDRESTRAGLSPGRAPLNVLRAVAPTLPCPALFCSAHTHGPVSSLSGAKKG